MNKLEDFFGKENIRSFMQEQKKKEVAILERLRRFGGEWGSEIDRFIDPSKAKLKDMIKSEYYPRRKIDIERMLAIATININDKEPVRSPVKILDLGGGKGLLAKLLADQLEKRKTPGFVIDLDNDKEKLEKAKKFYKNTPNLKFIISSSEKEAANIFNTEFNLIITSWAHPSEMGGPDYSSTIKKLNPPVFINIGEEGQEFTAKFDAGDNYVKIGEWFGPLSEEISTGRPSHMYFGESDEFIRKNGSNMFEVYVRKDINADQINKIKASLLAVKSQSTDEYPWEHELNEFYPIKDNINFDPNTFWRQSSDE